MLPYSSERVRLVPVPFAGGDSLAAKASLLLVARQYITTMMRELRELDPENDAVHVRCPAPVSLVAIMLMSVLRSPRKRWVKYAGNWHPEHFDSIGYAIQRWWLKGDFARAKVSVNGYWPDQPRHVTAFVNPCLTSDELNATGPRTGTKLAPLRLVFVGRVEEKKGVRRALEIVKRLLAQGLDVRFDIIGDGPQRAEFESFAAIALQNRVTFHGWVPRPALGPFLTEAHLMLFPSDCSEGWPKVLSEGMAYGVVPVASNVGSIPHYLRECEVGATCNPYDLDAFANAVALYASQPDRWEIESIRSMRAAERFTYDLYLDNVCRLLDLKQGVPGCERFDA